MATAIPSPTGILWLTIHCSNPPGCGGGAACARALSAGRPSKVSTPASQVLTAVGLAFSHSVAAMSGCFMPVQDRRHHFALAAQGELQIGEQAADVGAFGAVALAGHGINRRAAVIGAEQLIAAGEVFQVEAHVHGMRFPGQEHDGLLVAVGALHLRQHALFAGLDQFEAAQAELILLEHFQHMPVAVVAGFDAVDRVVERGSEALNVLEVLAGPAA